MPAKKKATEDSAAGSKKPKKAAKAAPVEEEDVFDINPYVASTELLQHDNLRVDKERKHGQVCLQSFLAVALCLLAVDFACIVTMSLLWF